MGLDNAYGLGSLRTGICTSTTRPSSPYVGQMIYETDTNLVRVYRASGWDVPLAGPAPVSVQYLVVGGGGGGTGGSAGVFGSGGNAGQVLSGTTTVSLSSNFTVTVGSGGAGNPANTSGGTGASSVALGITATGGTGGVFTVSGANGTGASGSGRTGITTTITGSSISLGGGGGGASASVSTSSSIDGGGRGGNTTDNSGVSGTANTGGGGGGSYNNAAVGSGGSGVVYLRYNSAFSITVGAGLTASTSTVGTDKVTTFTAGTGSISFS